MLGPEVGINPENRIKHKIYETRKYVKPEEKMMMVFSYSPLSFNAAVTLAIA